MYFLKFILRFLGPMDYLEFYYSFQVFGDFPVIFMFRTWSILVYGPWAPEKNVNCAVLGWSFLQMLVTSCWLMVLSSSLVLLISDLVVPSTVERGMSKPLIISMEFSTNFFGSIHF